MKRAIKQEKDTEQQHPLRNKIPRFSSASDTAAAAAESVVLQQPQPQHDALFTKSLITATVQLSMYRIDSGIAYTLFSTLKQKVEGKCIKQGFVRPNSVELFSYSPGVVKNEFVVFDTVYYADVCYPMVGQVVHCTIKSITKGGLHMFVRDEESNTCPVIVFVSAEYHRDIDFDTQFRPNQKVAAEIIGIKFQLNDRSITAIAKLKL